MVHDRHLAVAPEPAREQHAPGGHGTDRGPHRRLDFDAVAQGLRAELRIDLAPERQAHAPGDRPAHLTAPQPGALVTAWLGGQTPDRTLQAQCSRAQLLRGVPLARSARAQQGGQVAPLDGAPAQALFALLSRLTRLRQFLEQRLRAGAARLRSRSRCAQIGEQDTVLLEHTRQTVALARPLLEARRGYELRHAA